MAREIAHPTDTARSAVSLASLPRKLTVALRAYQDALRARFGDRLKEMRLFGSYARGEAGPESDVDVFVAVEGLTHAERDVAFDLAYEVELHGEWVGLSPLVYSTEQANDLRSRERALLAGIDRDGVSL